MQAHHAKLDRPVNCLQHGRLATLKEKAFLTKLRLCQGVGAALGWSNRVSAWYSCPRSASSNEPTGTAASLSRIARLPRQQGRHQRVPSLGAAYQSSLPQSRPENKPSNLNPLERTLPPPDKRLCQEKTPTPCLCLQKHICVAPGWLCRLGVPAHQTSGLQALSTARLQSTLASSCGLKRCQWRSRYSDAACSRSLGGRWYSLAKPQIALLMSCARGNGTLQ